MIRGRSLRQQALQAWVFDSGLLMTFQLVSTVVGAATFVLVARILGRSEFGAFAGVLGLAQAASLFLDAGLGAYLLRELSAVKSDAVVGKSTLVSEALWLESRLLTVVVPAAAITSVAVTGQAWLAVLTALLLVYVGVLAFATSVEAFFRAQRNVTRVGQAAIIEKLLAFVGVGGLLAVGNRSAVSIGVILVTSAVARFVFGYSRFLTETHLGAAPRSSRARALGLVRATFPFVVTSVVIVIIPRLAVTGVAIVSTIAAAYFALGERLINASVVYCMSLSETLYPHIARGALRARDALIVQFGVGAAAAIVIAVVARPVVNVAFGDVSDGAILAIRVMAVAVPFIFLTNGLLVQAYTRKLERYTSMASLAATAVGMVAIIMCAMRWGAVGAAAAYVARQFLSALSLGVLVWIVSLRRDRTGRRAPSALTLKETQARNASGAVADPAEVVRAGSPT